MFFDDFPVRDTANPIFYSRSGNKKPDVVKIRRPIVGTNRIVVDIENDANLICNSVDFYEANAPILNSSKIPITSERTAFARYEKEKLFSDIDAAIEKSKSVSAKARMDPNFGTNLIEIYEPGDITHRDLTLPSYNGRPYHISVRSTKSPKIDIHAQRPEITRRELGAETRYLTERRQPNVSVNYLDNRKKWNVGSDGENLKYAKSLEKNYGKRDIHRYFGTDDLEAADRALKADNLTTGWQKVAGEYRKELKRQSERSRLEPPRSKWWESTAPDFHYHFHKNKYLLDQAEHHHKMQQEYLDKLARSSQIFWQK